MPGGALVIRRAGKEDVLAVTALARAAYARWVPILGREPMPMGADYATAIAEDIVDLFEADGRLVAMVQAKVEPEHLFIVSLAVDPELQHNGIGIQLLDHAEKLARDAQRSEIRLHTNSLMQSNIDYYERNNYVVFERELRPGIAIVVHMKKALT